MNAKVLIAVGAIALVSLTGVLTWYYWPEPVPKFQVKNAEGQPVAFDELFDGKDYMLIVFLLPNCGLSKFSSGVVNEQYAKFGDRMSFVGLVFGTYQTGQQVAKADNLSFPIYGLRDAPDPFVMQELVGVVGGMGSMIYGGTVVVVDRDGDIVFQLEREEVRELPERLGK